MKVISLTTSEYQNVDGYTIMPIISSTNGKQIFLGLDQKGRLAGIPGKDMMDYIADKLGSQTANIPAVARQPRGWGSKIEANKITFNGFDEHG
ncbi:hypothetical protein LTR94_034774, partial [Friedmanniomyces endolithicus]